MTFNYYTSVYKSEYRALGFLNLQFRQRCLVRRFEEQSVFQFILKIFRGWDLFTKCPLFALYFPRRATVMSRHARNSTRLQDFNFKKRAACSVMVRCAHTLWRKVNFVHFPGHNLQPLCKAVLVWRWLRSLRHPRITWRYGSYWNIRDKANIGCVFVYWQENDLCST